eukprot:m.218512 g.218512  ORF g.218512 m.218512 type:complete len:55 (-) comp54119_c0_seq3:469-633(-)
MSASVSSLRSVSSSDSRADTESHLFPLFGVELEGLCRPRQHHRVTLIGGNVCGE